MTDSKHASRFDHASRVLALPDVLERIAASCVNAGAAAAVRARRPLDDEAHIRARLAEIEEYRALRKQSGGIGIAETNYRDAVARIAGGERGTGDDFRRIAEGERAVAELHRFVSSSAADYPALGAIAARAVPNHDLVKEIDRAIDGDGNVRDDATPALKSIRRDIRAARGSLRERAEKMVGDLGADAHATVMGERHVLEVPRGKERRGTGLVHGASQSGGSL
jgi:DNA mismatch repair protein MutS2